MKYGMNQLIIIAAQIEIGLQYKLKKLNRKELGRPKLLTKQPNSFNVTTPLPQLNHSCKPFANVHL